MDIKPPKEIDFIINKLGDARVVGGFIRDSILGNESNDIDIVTPLLPDMVIKKLEKFAKVIPTGIKHGTVTAIYHSIKMEITTIRKDISCDGRHAEVLFSTDYKEDARRRDFTINAMSYSIKDNKIYDYFSGIEDLRARRVVFVGSAEERIKEDYLRILRFFRFSDRYANALDEEAMHYSLLYKDQMKRLSKERISSELLKLLSYAVSTDIINILYKKRFLDFAIDCIWEVEAMNIAFSLGIKMELYTKLAILFKGLSSEGLSNIKIPSKIIGKINLIRGANSGDIDIFCYKNSYEMAIQMLIYNYAFGIYSKEDVMSLRCSLQSIKKMSIMPIDGKYLLSLGYEGKEIGVMLQRLEKKWVREDVDADALKQYINEINK